MNKVLAVAVAALVIMVAAFAWHAYNVRHNAPQFVRYNLNIGVNNSSIDSLSINNFTYSNLGGHWFNTSLLGYSNYSVTFPYYVIYGGHVNETAHVYLDRNMTVTFNATKKTTYGPIYV